jgi:hydrogenase expression/formation protein HypC
MCLSIPGKVVSVNNDRARVDYGFEVREVDTRLVKPEVGDWVLVQNKFVVELVSEEDALNCLDELTSNF